MALPASAKRDATFDDLHDVPEHHVAEIIDGDLYASPRPATLHAQAASSLGGELYGPFERGRGGPGGWILLDEPELRLGSNAMVPDLAGWKRERMPQLPDTGAITLAPDWVCEVVSPSAEALDRSVKMPRYAQAGVSFAWLIDPRAQSLEVYQIRDGSWHLHSQFQRDAAVRAVPFDEAEIELAALWRR